MVSGNNKNPPESTTHPPKDPIKSLIDKYVTNFFHELLARDVRWNVCGRTFH